MTEWTWDSSLYGGSAPYYALGRIAYPGELAVALAEALGLDGSGRLLDIGCGPGSLTLLLADRFAEVVGVDADRDMIAEADRLAAEAGTGNAHWVCRRAEELPADLGAFRLITFAQSFHWMDRPRVAAIARGMLEPGGACAHVHANTHIGVDGSDLPHSRPPHERIAALAERYLGPIRRAGRGLLPHGTPAGESAIYRAAGFGGPERIEIPGRTVTRGIDEVVAGVFSQSRYAPDLFGGERTSFETDLRTLLSSAAPDGIFAERTRDIAVDLWRP